MTQALPSITSLRFFAAYGVVIYHLDVFLGPPAYSEIIGRLTIGGATGVSFFFILSGFVLAWRGQDRLPAGVFYGRRFARVYPAYALMLVVAIVVSAAAGHAIGIAGIASAVTLVQAWIPRYETMFAINPVLWSLSCEVFFYAVFPVIASVIHRLDSRAQRRLLIACVATPFAIALSAPGWERGPLWYWVAYFPVSRLPEFVLGIVLAYEVRAGRWRLIPRRTALAGAMVAMLATGAFGTSFRFTVVVTVIPYALAIVAAARSDMDGERDLLQHPVLIRLGSWSYALFLVHAPVIYVVRAVLPPTSVAAAIVGWALATMLALGAAATLHHLWERPAERRLRPEHTDRSTGIPLRTG